MISRTSALSIHLAYSSMIIDIANIKLFRGCGCNHTRIEQHSCTSMVVYPELLQKHSFSLLYMYQPLSSLMSSNKVLKSCCIQGQRVTKPLLINELHSSVQAVLLCPLLSFHPSPFFLSPAWLSFGFLFCFFFK